LAGPVRDALKSIDADQPFFDMMDLEERISRSYSQRSANLILIGTCSALALILAFIGIYGVVSYTVSRRTHEIGIRRALGAQSFDIMQMIVKQFMTSAIVGLVLGLAGAFALMRYISSLLYRVSATDPAVFAGISALVLISAFLAGYIPSRQATKIDLSATLRNE
jgi:putative ABC transport system permease protein